MSRIKNLLVGYFNRVYFWNSHRDANLWTFGEWFGEKCCDNCLALANEIAEKHSEIVCCWVADKQTDLTYLSKKIRVFYMDSAETREILRKSGVIIMNQGYFDFSKKGIDYFGGAVTINLWHGLMWKKIGFDIRKSQGTLASCYHSLEKKIENADFWLVPAEEMKKHFVSAFMTDSKHMIFGGYPRNVILYNHTAVADMRRKIEKRINKDLIETPNNHSIKIIAYMPTFRDRTEDVFSFKNIEENEKLNEILNKYNAVVIEKSHFVTMQRNKKEDSEIKNGRVLGMNDILAAELLAASDMLITDYSSCFFDYLLLNRPIIHYIYDYEYYVNNDRGVYYSKDEIACGKTPQNLDDLLAAMDEYLKDPMKDRELRIRQKERFWEYDSEETCETIYKRIREIQKRGKQ